VARTNESKLVFEAVSHLIQVTRIYKMDTSSFPPSADGKMKNECSHEGICLLFLRSLK
jgi:hypothetical protein